jgi:hypothetical protein
VNVDLGPLGLDGGGHLLLDRALRMCERIEVRGVHPELHVHLGAWARLSGHRYLPGDPAIVDRGPAPAKTQIAGMTRYPEQDPPAAWGVAARAARVELGGPEWRFALADREAVWSDDVPRLYAQAAAAQWDPARAIEWVSPDLPEEIEDAVVQVMTYLVENEVAALQVPARFIAEIHPHFREVLQLLAIQAADEARHIEVFTRRAQLRRTVLGSSTVGGQASLKTLYEEPDFAMSGFLLAVLGEGSFLSLLRFLSANAPDSVTRQVTRLAAQDEARHVAFGLGHLARHAAHEPSLLPRLAAAVERRHAALQHTAGLNREVFDALVVLAAGSFAPDDIARGWGMVDALRADMDLGRKLRLSMLGFGDSDAERLSGLHTRNFM